MEIFASTRYYAWQLLVTQISRIFDPDGRPAPRSCYYEDLRRFWTNGGTIDPSDSYDQLDADRAAMADARRDYEQRLANIEEQARERIQAAIKDGQDLRDSLVADARKQSESIIEQGRNDIQRERRQAFIEMRQQIVSLAISAAGKVVGESLNDARQTKLVDDFIGSVGTGSVSDAGRGAHSYASGNGKGAE